ncbi:ABC transporter permease [Algoriphagus persicinus]|uniref:ABC transporter permease n=1 Tax=Algoriphagus persicinus TaxID=3108754 RepID=UPI002B3C91B9|nr:ABC transporter permease [Algoriphagus sp. E1-3-M2]MEB2786003.1 ABC transporter permease [Algoriphagus sp. E1-3-M2]
MWKNYLKIAIRNLTKNKLHTGINLIGLTLGMGVSTLIFFFVQFESNFDDFHSESDKIFRIERHQVEEGESFTSFSTPIITAPTFASEFSQVTHTTRMISGSAQTYLDEETTQNQSYLMVSPDFLEIFSFELLQGNKNQVLQDKFSVLITEEVAKKYFGEADPIGKPMRMLMGDNYEEYQVAGLLKDLPANSSIQFFISFLLITSTLIMVNQMEVIRDYDLGFDQNMVILVDVPDVPSTSFVKSINASFTQAEKYRQALAVRSEVQSAGITIATYGDDAFWDGGFPMEDGKQFNFRLNFVGGEYVKTLGLELAQGRDLNAQPGSDSTAVLINETFAKAMNWVDPLGELLPSKRIGNHEIVGVVKDFNHNSFGDI